MTGLIDRLNFKDTRLYLDGTEILNVPGNKSNAEINIITTDENKIYVGTGGCCKGYLLELERHDKSFNLEEIFAVDFCVLEILPVVLPGNPAGNPKSALVSGYGCAGSGIRMINLYGAKSTNVMSTEDFKAITGVEHRMPRFRTDNGKISIELTYAGYRLKPGMKKQPGVPEFLAGPESEFYTSDDVYASRDITAKLEEIGVDVAKTIDEAKAFRKIKRKGD